jgi:hypothetical protein
MHKNKKTIKTSGAHPGWLIVRAGAEPVAQLNRTQKWMIMSLAAMTA